MSLLVEDSLALRAQFDFFVERKQTLSRTTHQTRGTSTVAILQWRIGGGGGGEQKCILDKTCCTCIIIHVH